MFSDALSQLGLTFPGGATGADSFRSNDLTNRDLVMLLLAGQLNTASGGKSVTPVFTPIGASGSATIPAGARGWSVSILTGTGTVGGIAVAAGFRDGDSGILAAPIVVATNAASSAYVRWGT